MYCECKKWTVPCYDKCAGMDIAQWFTQSNTSEVSREKYIQDHHHYLPCVV